jgi:hypothetical protein
MNFILRLASRYLTRKADVLEHELRFGPYPPGTYGAEMLRFAGNLRKLAEDILPAPKESIRR